MDATVDRQVQELADWTERKVVAEEIQRLKDEAAAEKERLEKEAEEKRKVAEQSEPKTVGPADNAKDPATANVLKPKARESADSVTDPVVTDPVHTELNKVSLAQ